MWVLCGGYPVSVVTTPLVCLGRMSATWSYTNSTVLGRTSGTEQLHCSIKWNFLCSCCSITDWQLRSGWYSGVLYTESNESSWLASPKFSKVSSNIIPLIYHYILPSDIQTKISNLIFFSTNRLTCTTNLIPLKPITILSTLLLTSPSHPPISPSTPHS